MSAASLKNLLLVAGAHTLVCLAAVNYFRRSFGISPWLIAIHLPLLLAMFAAGLAGTLLIAGPTRWRRLAAASLPASCAIALMTLYGANFATNLWLGVNVTHKLVGLWASDWWAGGQIMPLSGGVVAAVAAGALTIFAALVALWFRALAGVERPRFRRWPAVIGLIVVGLYAVFFYQLSWRTPRSELLSADPILAFLRTTVTVQDERQLAITARLRQEEPACRAGYAPRRPFESKNVIVIIVDSLRADHMQVYGYERPTTPFLDRLWREGRLRKVDVATSICAESNCGIIATLFSKTLRHQIPEDFKLYDLLRDRGYETNFILSGNHDWQGLREMYGNEMTRYFDGRDSATFGRSDDRLIFEGLERVPDPRAPAFFYFHLMSVHLLGTKQERFRDYHPSEVQNDWDALFRGEHDRESVTNNYDNGVRQADATIEELFGALDRKGYLKNSVVAILSDHGEGLGERGPTHFGHVTSLKQEFIQIPLLIYDDSPVPYANVRYATQLDVAPTLIDRLGLPVPACWEGRSLLSDASPPRATFHQTTVAAPCFAVLDRSTGRTLKYSYCTRGRYEELYDLGSDPGELINLIETADARLVARLRERLRQWRER